MSNLAQRAIRDNGFAVTNVGPKFVAFETGMTWGSWSGATCSISIEEIEMNCFAAHGSGKQNIRGAQLIAVDFGEAKGKVGKVIDRMKVLGGHIPQPLAWYFKTSFIVLMFLTLPPFALPSVWLHPKLHVVWKLLITAAVLGFCWLSYVAFTGFVKQFDEATKMLNDFKM